ncbi:uncharacterized protein ACIB01_019678 isoform 1-T2 [Guaruba guarouba]
MFSLLLKKKGATFKETDSKLMSKWLKTRYPEIEESTVFEVSLRDGARVKLWDAATKGDDTVKNLLSIWRTILEMLKSKNEIAEPSAPPKLRWSPLQLQRLREGMKTILLTRALLILRKSLLSDHLKPEGGNVLIALDNAETPEHSNEEPVHVHQTAVAAPEILKPDNFDADLDRPFDPKPVDPEKEPDLPHPDPHDKWAAVKGEVRWVGDADVLGAFLVVYVPDQNLQWEGLSYVLIKDIRQTVIYNSFYIVSL